jgi:hypothetical protein
MRKRSMILMLVVSTFVLSLPFLAHAQYSAWPIGPSERLWTYPWITYPDKPPMWNTYQGGQAIQWMNWYQNQRFAVAKGSASDGSDDIVLDKATGLVWERKSTGFTGMSVGWLHSYSSCHYISHQGLWAWHLPTVEELSTLLEGTSLPWGHPFDINADNNYFWTSSSYADGFAYLVELGRNPPCIGSSKDGLAHYWCVRGGSAPQAY